MNTTHLRDGIWYTLPPHRADHFRRFIAEYEFIRAAEGRGSTQAEYYLSLPYKDLSGRNSDQWAIRAHTFQTIERLILTPLARLRRRPLRILDLGAGNGWMSYRLALCGHLPVAVDLLTNNLDGLGASVHYSTQIRPLFPRIQAELDRLPISSSSFDVAIFNASFHYSEDYQRTFAEALRCTRPGGSVVIADTPWYEEEDSGKRMVAEKHQRFTAMYGFPSDSVPSLEYLTPDRLHPLQISFGLKWRCIRPFYGIRWALRPVRAKLKGRRPPSHFHIYAAQVSA
ncbi:MAG TPA: class I SAM-dependent methyltransferase [Acidobacteriaceae bacterium]|nr:class I SAM-dependent methyltransferase [Acidobacteriaceae bacterium]